VLLWGTGFCSDYRLASLESTSTFIVYLLWLLRGWAIIFILFNNSVSILIFKPIQRWVPVAPQVLQIPLHLIRVLAPAHRLILRQRCLPHYRTHPPQFLESLTYWYLFIDYVRGCREKVGLVYICGITVTWLIAMVKAAAGRGFRWSTTCFVTYLLLTVSLDHSILRRRDEIVFLFHLKSFRYLLNWVTAEIWAWFAAIANNLICKCGNSYWV
jgi:hypothetical protein